jgi:hypothetical protein
MLYSAFANVFLKFKENINFLSSHVFVIFYINSF